jgi:hypothetical protein
LNFFQAFFMMIVDKILHSIKCTQNSRQRHRERSRFEFRILKFILPHTHTHSCSIFLSSARLRVEGNHANMYTGIRQEGEEGNGRKDTHISVSHQLSQEMKVYFFLLSSRSLRRCVRLYIIYIQIVPF